MKINERYVYVDIFNTSLLCFSTTGKNDDDDDDDDDDDELMS